MDQRAFAGDLPIGLTLNDQAYDAYRHVATGNSYTALNAEQQKEGMHIEDAPYL